ncbi:MAG: hypothetical protein IJ563_07585 [Selenomonadaceae bacterium]|nr:hypothetical protein [Selenomonadaceae bacterium]MBR1858534.1 hypothetical protein [Selenomonadaceae bacterium]
MNSARENFVINRFIDIMKNCRQQLVADIINGNPDLFRFLFEDKNKKVQELYKKRYELKWLEMHWLKCKIIFNDSDVPLATRREVLKIFLQWYQKFIEAWGYKAADAFFFNAEVESLELLIETNRQWEAMLDQFQMSMIRETKLLDKQIEEVKES